MRVSSRAVSAGQRVRERPAARRAPPPVWARSPAPGIFLWTRTAIWAAALFALFTFVPNRHPLAGRWDDPSLTHDLGAVTDVWARWDSVWFLRIAEHGYNAATGAASAFYPLYPGAVAVLRPALFGPYVLPRVPLSPPAAFRAVLLLHPPAGKGPRPRPAPVEPASLARRPPGGDLGRPARRLGGRRAARIRLAHARLLDRRAGHRPDPGRDDQPRESRVPRALRRARRRGLAAVRRRL